MRSDNTKMKDYSKKIFTVPNIMSLCRIALIPFIAMFYFSDKPEISGYLLIISGVTDIVDGFIARRFNLISDIGKVLDPTADKLTQAVMLICLVVKYPLVLLPFIILIIKEIFMTVSGYIIMKRFDVVLGANWHGKLATVALYGMLIVHAFAADIDPAVSSVLILLSAALIVLSFVMYAIRNLGILIRSPKKKEPVEGK